MISPSIESLHPGRSNETSEVISRRAHRGHCHKASRGHFHTGTSEVIHKGTSEVIKGLHKDTPGHFHKGTSEVAKGHFPENTQVSHGEHTSVSKEFKSRR